MSHDNNFTTKQYLLGKKKRALQKLKTSLSYAFLKTIKYFG